MNNDGLQTIRGHDDFAAFVDTRVAGIEAHKGGWLATYADGGAVAVDGRLSLITAVIAAFANSDLRYITRGLGVLLAALENGGIRSVRLKPMGSSRVVAEIKSATGEQEVTLNRQTMLPGMPYSLEEFFKEIGPSVHRFAAGRSLAPLPRQFFRQRACDIIELSRRGKFDDIIALPPLMLTVGVTDQCNFKCAMCFRTRRGYIPNRFIFPVKTLRQLILDMAEMGIPALRFCGEGENMLHPHFLEALLLAKAVGLRTFIITNGTRLHAGYQVAARCLDYLRVSFNALDPEHYLKTHGIKRTGTYFQVLESLKNARLERDQLGAQLPIITISSVICRDAIYETAQARLARDLSSVGIDFLTLKSDRLWEMSEGEKQKYLGVISYLQRENIRVTDYSGYTSPPITPQRDWERKLSIGCAVRLIRANIDQFEVHSCVTQHEVYGTITEHRLTDIWASAQRAALQHRRAKSASPGCEKCFWGDLHRIMNFLFGQEVQ